jgi:hypothetical protein
MQCIWDWGVLPLNSKKFTIRVHINTSLLAPIDPEWLMMPIVNWFYRTVNNKALNIIM